jgi:hypothetical protein
MNELTDRRTVFRDKRFNLASGCLHSQNNTDFPIRYPE